METFNSINLSQTLKTAERISEALEACVLALEHALSQSSLVLEGSNVDRANLDADVANLIYDMAAARPATQPVGESAANEGSDEASKQRSANDRDCWSALTSAVC